MMKALPVFVLGDGHARYMVSAQWHRLFAPRKVEVCEVGGATAGAGNRNPNVPAVDAVAKFRDFIEKRSRDSIVVIHLGEADCGYVIWYRAGKFGEGVAEQLEQSVAAYFEFVDELIAKGFKHIVITGASLPTITDAEQSGGVIKARSDITATQRQRTDLTLAYNERLREQAMARDLLYTDITEDVLDPDTGLVQRDFRNVTPAERIMNVRMAGPLWAHRLNASFEILDPLAAPTHVFTATVASVAKGLALHSKDIPPNLKMATKENDQLVAKLLQEIKHEGGEYFVISDGVLNGEPLGSLIRLLHKAHWKRTEDPVPAMAEPIAEPAPAEEMVVETIEEPPPVIKTSRLSQAKERVFGKKTRKKKSS